MQSYDLIGDIHGQAYELEALLKKLGYSDVETGYYHHDNRKVIFLGDFVDRGKKQKGVLDIVQPMINAGSALSVMGNHEFNAISYYTKHRGTGEYLRPHIQKNTDQHEAFLSEYADKPNEYEDVINWFMTLPLWLDLGDLRIVHACWDQKLMDKSKAELGDDILLTPDFLEKSSDSNYWQYDAIETLLKGKEISLPKGQSFKDKDGTERKNIRVRWWDQTATTYKNAFMGPESARTHIPNDEISGDHLVDYGHNQPPVFLGHYWMEGKPKPLAKNIACLDYSVAHAKGKLVAYQWDGESEINIDKYIFVDRE